MSFQSSSRISAPSADDRTQRDKTCFRSYISARATSNPFCVEKCAFLGFLKSLSQVLRAHQFCQTLNTTCFATGQIVADCPDPSEVESDTFCGEVLRARMSEGNLNTCKIHPDVCQYHPRDQEGDEDAEAMLAGFPCQVPALQF